MKEIDLVVGIVVGVAAAVMSFLAWVICRASGRTDDDEEQQEFVTMRHKETEEKRKLNLKKCKTKGRNDKGIVRLF